MAGEDAVSFKPKKSVALSGVVAGDTAICTVGHSGNDLHYRGYDILDIAETCEFEEIAYLLVHGKLPNPAQLLSYKARLRGLRGLSNRLRALLELLPATAHPMDVLRTAVSVIGAIEQSDPADDDDAVRALTLLAKMPAIVAYEQRRRRGQPLLESRHDLDYCENFL